MLTFELLAARTDFARASAEGAAAADGEEGVPRQRPMRGGSASPRGSDRAGRARHSWIAGAARAAMAVRERGNTLVDVVVAATLLLLVFGLTIPGFMLAEDTITTVGTKDHLERTGDRILSEVLAILRSGRLASISPPGEPPSLTVHRVRTDIELADLTDETGDLFEPEPVVISFRAVRTLAESDLGTDLNRDGDLVDEFALGALDLSDGEHARSFSGRPVLLLGLPSFQADLDGDGLEDPLFSFDGAAASVGLRLVSVQPGGQVLSTSLRGSVRPRNSQE